MKKIIFFLSVTVLLTACASLKGEGSKSKETFTVYGNCSMCETKIEAALQGVEGIAWADWEVETLELTVKFDSSVITLDQIKQRIADVGYDSDSHRAKDEVYNNLHACCKYERPKK